MIAYSIETRLVLIVSIVAIVIVYAISFAYRKIRGQPIGFKADIRKIAFVFYLIVIACFTLFPILVPPIESQPIEYNFDLTYLLNAFSDRSSLIGVAGNIMLFVPIPILGKINNIKCFNKLSSTIITSAIISVLIEVLQGVETISGLVDPACISIVDVNDVITNVIGGIVGWIVIYYYRKEHQ